MLRTQEIITFDSASTKRVETPMPIALRTLVVTARVGHKPSEMTKIGFSFHKPLANSFQAVIKSEVRGQGSEVKNIQWLMSNA